MKTAITLLSTLMTLTALSATAANPVDVNASDLIGKVYCVADPSTGKMECRQAADTRFNATPVEEDGAEWLSEGFHISYSGMTPEAEAMARYNDGEVAGYGYVFYFPYEATRREEANSCQCAFCSALLQELTDMGVSLGANPMTDALFDVAGVFQGGDVQLTLRENIESETESADLQAGAIPADRQGEFVLLISVVPANSLGFTADLAE